MKVVWTFDAQQDRTNIWDHIASNNALAAAAMDQRFSDVAARLGEYPKLGQTGKIAGTFFLMQCKKFL